MSSEYGTDIITLIDEEGAEHEFEILDVIENDNRSFYALLPMFNSAEDSINSDGMYFIFEEIEENGEKQLAEIEDDNLLDHLAEIFESRFEELYEYDEDVDDNLN